MNAELKLLFLGAAILGNWSTDTLKSANCGLIALVFEPSARVASR